MGGGTAQKIERAPVRTPDEEIKYLKREVAELREQLAKARKVTEKAVKKETAALREQMSQLKKERDDLLKELSRSHGSPKRTHASPKRSHGSPKRAQTSSPTGLLRSSGLRRSSSASSFQSIVARNVDDPLRSPRPLGISAQSLKKPTAPVYERSKH